MLNTELGISISLKLQPENVLVIDYQQLVL